MSDGDEPARAARRPMPRAAPAARRRPARSGRPPPGVQRVLLGPERARLRGLPRPRPAAGRAGAGVLRHAVGLVRAGLGHHARHVALHGWAADPGSYSETYRCPHGFVSNEHRSWGQNLEQPWVEEAWAQGYGTAYARMLEEAGTLGAHGVIGVADRVSNVADTGTTEFHFLGTAVTVEGGPPPAGGVPWSTYLAGQRLTKSIEAGFMPVAVVAALASVRVWAYCMTEYYMEGSMGGWGPTSGPALVEQVSKAHMASRQLARKHVREQLAGDELHGATMDVVTRELSAGRRGHRLHACGATGCGASRTTTRSCCRGPRCGWHERQEPDGPSPGPAPAPTSTSGPRCSGAPRPWRPRLPHPRSAASPPTSRSTRRSCSTPPGGSPSTSSAASPWCRSRSGCGTGGGAPSHSPRTPTTRRWTRPPGCCAGSAARCTATAWSGCGSTCRCARTTSTSSWSAPRCAPWREGEGRPGPRRRAGHALRVRPVGPRLHPAAAGRLDARRPGLRGQLRLRPPAHRRHRHEADDGRTSS